MDFIVKNAMENANTYSGQFEVGHANIKVIGCGGAGNNMVNWLYKKGVKGAEIIACNTDKQHLDVTEADKKFLIGTEVTRGLGCGGFPQKGAEAAQESIMEIKDSIKGSDMIFVCAGMGGGTGTGSAPIVASAARDTGAIVIGTVTMPFKIERARVDKAEFGLAQLREVSDTVIVIDNNRLVQIAGNLPIQQAFAVANELIATMIKGIVETIAVPSLVNLDFADVKTIMTNGGVAAIGVGASDTNNRVDEAVNGALSNPLLDINYEGATGALIHVHGGPDLTLEEINKVGELVTETMDDDANCIWGARVSDDMKGRLTVMTIITGVQSPWILGKCADRNKEYESEMEAVNNELGIEIIR
ncbi:cell division protein FtsZ [Candidatus Woesearchaeota archaeon]|nr:cell division protein FtsZ [Candidatus Woesearchaeota archaeon]MBT5272233.1 cell division protein FtsZ [Candidatus Woesearchaeota archaeon]MBT6040529.1 cell division protein FtsZ [Candidatus Woesearchaeota archaeon]MBT6336505.1 cell division protein FtsZ [Candidatus Woesearchaeota archaeon]MBT7927395.1 cell division protein FtsZ [Candidatus Woesearchaeota archaeon]